MPTPSSGSITDRSPSRSAPGSIWAGTRRPRPMGWLAIAPGLEVGKTQTGGDEGLEGDGIQRRPEPVQDPTHQAEVDSADDVAALTSETAERTVAQADRIAGVHRAVGLEAEITEKTDQASDRVSLAGRGRRIPDQGATPPLAGIQRCCSSVRRLCELVREGGCQASIGVRRRLVRVRHDGVAEAWSTAPGRAFRGAGDQTGVDQLVEVFADRVRVETQRASKLADP